MNRTLLKATGAIIAMSEERKSNTMPIHQQKRKAQERSRNQKSVEFKHRIEGHAHSVCQTKQCFPM